MSSRKAVLAVLRKLCGKPRAPRMWVFDHIVNMFWSAKFVWKIVDEVMVRDICSHEERKGTMVGVLFRRHALVVFFCEAMAAQLPVDKFGSDHYSVRLRYFTDGIVMEGCLLHVTEMGPEEMVFETLVGNTVSVLDALLLV